MPNRMIQDSIRTNGIISGLSDGELRIWLGLIVAVDDFGRFHADPKIIKGHCFALVDSVTPAKIRCTLEKLDRIGSIRLYEAENRSYFRFTNWRKYQTTRAKTSKYPAPPEEADDFRADAGDFRADAGGPRTDADGLQADVCSLQADAPVNGNENGNENENGKRNTAAERCARFTPPTRREVEDYRAERDSGVDPDKFFDYYEANGWRVGRNSMKDWRAAFRSWEAGDRKRERSSNPFLAIAEGLA